MQDRYIAWQVLLVTSRHHSAAIEGGPISGLC